MAKTIQINMTKKSGSSSLQLYEVSFKVVDNDNSAAIKDVTIQWEGKAGLTNNYGVCLMSLLAGNYTVTASHVDYETKSVTFTLP